MSRGDVKLFHLAPLRQWLLAGSRAISPICSESLQAFVSVLSRVDTGGQVEAPPSAAVATASGINPVSRDYTVDYYLIWTHTTLEGQSELFEYKRSKVTVVSPLL